MNEQINELLKILERTHAGHSVGHDQSDQQKGGYSDGYVNGFGACIELARKVINKPKPISGDLEK